MLEACERILSYVAGFDPEKLKSDQKTVDAVVRNLEVMGEAAKRVSDETRALAPYQNATGMQVTSAVLAGMVWGLENPSAGIVEADEMDYRRCLEVQRPYLGPVNGFYTDWTPLTDRPGSSRRTSTRATRGSSGTCWCGEECRAESHRLLLRSKKLGVGRVVSVGVPIRLVVLVGLLAPIGPT
jgi:hypothetical protein